MRPTGDVCTMVGHVPRLAPVTRMRELVVSTTTGTDGAYGCSGDASTPTLATTGGAYDMVAVPAEYRPSRTNSTGTLVPWPSGT